MITLARSQNLFLMEGLWTKTLPLYQELRALITAGRIGEIRAISTEYFFRAEKNADSRLFDPAKGGGALLDIGIYGLTFVSMFLGTQPSQITSTALIGDTGVDESTQITLHYPGGALASILCSIITPAPQQAVIRGSKGRIEIPEYGRAERATVYIYGEEAPSGQKAVGVVSNVPAGGKVLELHQPFQVNGFEYEIRAVSEAIRAGKKELDLVRLDDSLALAQIMDQARSQWKR